VRIKEERERQNADGKALVHATEASRHYLYARSDDCEDQLMPRESGEAVAVATGSEERRLAPRGTRARSPFDGESQPAKRSRQSVSRGQQVLRPRAVRASGAGPNWRLRPK
jgi:hypothetical protein